MNHSSGYASSSSTEELEPAQRTARPRPVHQSPLAKVVATESAKRGPSDRFRREREAHYANVSAHELVRLLVAEEYESKKSKRMLDAALAQLDAFSRHYYTSEAEQKAEFTHLQQLIAAQQEGIAAKQQVELYKMRLESAQAEITRAQRILDMVEKQRDEAEDAAARVRAKARKLNEERLSTIARDNGRREGFEDGVRAGKLEAERVFRAEQEETWRQEQQRQIEYGPSPARSAYIEEELDDEDEEPLPVPNPRAGRGVTIEDDEDEDEFNIRPPTVSSSRRAHLGRVRGAHDSPRRSVSSAGTSSPSASVRRRTTSLGSSVHEQRRYDDGRHAHPLHQSISTGPSASAQPMSARQREKQPEDPVVPFMPGLEAPSDPQPQPQPQPQTPLAPPTPTQQQTPPSIPVPQVPSYVRPPSVVQARTSLGHFPMPAPPSEAHYMFSSNGSQMPTATIPVGDALRNVRASQRSDERMPVASVPQGDELRGIRARQEGQIPNARVPSSASDLAKIRVTSSRHTSEGSLPTPVVPSGEEGLRGIRASSRANGSSMMPSVTIPHSPQDLYQIRASNDGGQMPTPTVPSGDQLRNIRASSRSGYPEGQMPTPTVPTGDDLRNIRASSSREGEMPTPIVPTGDGLRNIRANTSSREGQMPTPTVPTGDALRGIRASGHGEGQMPTPTVPTGDDLRNIRANGTSSRAGHMPTPTVPTGDDLRNIRASGTSSRAGHMPTAAVPTGDELRNIRASSRNDREGQMPTATVPSGEDLRNIRASTKNGRMPTPSVPTGDQLRDIRTSSSGRHSTSGMPSAQVPQGADDLQSIRAHQSNYYAEPGVTMPTASVPSDAELRRVSSRSASGGAMPVASVPSGDDLRNIRAGGGSHRTSRSATDPTNRAAAGTPAYGRVEGAGVYTPTDSYRADPNHRRNVSMSSHHPHGYTSSSAGGHHRRPSSPESISSVGTATTMGGLVSFPSAEPQQGHHHRHSRGLSVIPEASTEYGSSRGSSSSARRASEEESRVKRESHVEEERRKRDAERQLQADRKESEMKQWARTRQATAAMSMPEPSTGAGASGNVEEWRRGTAVAQPPSTTGQQPGTTQSGYPATSYGSKPASSQQPVQAVYPSSSYGAEPTEVGTYPWAQSTTGLLSPGANLSRQSSVSSCSINIDVQSPSNAPSEVEENIDHPSGQYLSPNPSQRPLPQGQGSQRSRSNSNRNSVSVPRNAQIVHVGQSNNGPLPAGFVPTSPLMPHASSNLPGSHPPTQTPRGASGGSPFPSVVPTLPPGFVPDGSTTPRGGQSPLPGLNDLPPGFVPTSPLPTGVGLGIAGSSPMMRSSSMSNQPSPRFGGVGLGRPSSAMGERPVVPMTPSQTYVAVSSPPTNAFAGSKSPYRGGQGLPDAGTTSDQVESSGIKFTGAKGKKKKKNGR